MIKNQLEQNEFVILTKSIVNGIPQLVGDDQDSLETSRSKTEKIVLSFISRLGRYNKKQPCKTIKVVKINV